MVSHAAEQGAPMEITQDTVLDPARTYGPLVIKASNITVDGRGAWLAGATQGLPKSYKGTAVLARGVSRVTLRNLNAKGWETGLRVEDGEGWLIENCNFSDNFHDPDFGWGENGRRGGLILERLLRSVVRKVTANRVWDGCVLVECNENTVEDCDFSRASNTCLKLWNSCRNTIRNNNLSYGLRIKPGEVHARDSTSVLIESGSNDNRFLQNDCSHGGDGIFIRVLNGWVSTGNYLEGNDCSYANNNCVEAWAPRNVYVRNKANHGSYGFWLGASDQTVLIENEASHNGLPTGLHNSPHLPDQGHAGIVFMFGPSSHTVVRGNVCAGNNGAGIALIGDLDSQGRRWKAFHWIVEQNRLEGNRWGIYVQHADWIDMAGNVFKENAKGDVHQAGNVTNLVVHPAQEDVNRPPQAALAAPSSAKVGEKVVFDASRSSDPAGRALTFRWDLGDGTVEQAARVKHVFGQAGFCRVGLTVNNGVFSDLAWRDFYVVDDLCEIGTEGGAADWSWIDPHSKVKFSDDRTVRLAGAMSLHAFVHPYSGGRVSLLYPASRQAAWPAQRKTHLVFWLKVLNENVPAWQDLNPIVTLYESEKQFVRLTPKVDLLAQPPYNEAREGWYRFQVPLAGDEMWQRQGAELATINYLTLGFDSWGAPPLHIWVDGLAFREDSQQ